MKLIVHSVVAGSSATIPGTETFTSADIPSLPLIGDYLSVPGHGVCTVQHRGFLYGSGGVVVELYCAPAK